MAQMVARCVWDAEAAGSSPATPTSLSPHYVIVVRYVFNRMTRRTEKPIEQLSGVGVIRQEVNWIADVRYQVTLTAKLLEKSTAEDVHGFTTTGFLTVVGGEADLGRLSGLELHLDTSRWMSIFILKGDPASGSWHFTLGTGGAGGF